MAKRERVGHGVFSWDGVERRSDRYGGFVLGQSPYNGGVVAACHLDVKALQPLVGKRVHVTCKVVANRDSGHIGDLFHGIRPSKPKVGEVIDLGVGTLRLEPTFDSLTAIILEPGDGRERLWLDPRKLYRLHDQTVDLFVTATKKPFTPAPDLKAQTDQEAVDVGDGSFQVKGVEKDANAVIPHDVTKLGPGLFALDPASGREAGRRRKILVS